MLLMAVLSRHRHEEERSKGASRRRSVTAVTRLSVPTIYALNSGKANLYPWVTSRWPPSNIQLLIGITRHKLVRAQDETAEEIGRRMTTEDRPLSISSRTVFLAGTILSCPQCEEGLYKVTTCTSVQEVVLDDGMIPQPLNPIFPKRDAWRALACPFCGGQYYKDGKMHTVQNRWQ